MPTSRDHVLDTRSRLLMSAEMLFIDHGYEAMSLRMVTARAHANLAAVNYHFGSKEDLVKQLLAQRLDRLNADRLQLLDSSERNGRVPGCEELLGVLFVPALRLGRTPAGGPAFMRLLGRVYSDPSTFIRGYLQDHYRPIFGRFFEAFARALPQWPRNELGLRLHFALKALAGVLAADDMDQLIADLSMGEQIGDAQLLARLISLVSPALMAPFGSQRQIDIITTVLKRADACPDLRPPPPIARPPAGRRRSARHTTSKAEATR